MTVMAVETAQISLELGCSGECAEAFNGLYLQLSGGAYDECAVQPIPDNIDDWRDAHRTARKRSDRAYRRGYTFKPIIRHLRVDEIHAINLSASERQGRPMSASYRERPAQSPLPDYTCPRHAIRHYGVEEIGGRLVAYLSLYRAGQLALVSQILGHADVLRDEIMFLLVQGVLEREREISPDGFLVYNRWDSGTPGLRFNKERLGFEPAQVRWLP